MQTSADPIRAGRLSRPIDKLIFYAFFLAHSGAFTAAALFLAYGDVDQAFPQLPALYFVGLGYLALGLPLYVYAFGIDEGRWLVINTVIGFVGITAEIRLLVSFLSRSFDDFGWHIHAAPFFMYVLFTFLSRQLVLDLCDARGKPARKQRVEWTFVALSLLAYGAIHLLLPRV